jgi:hypothetical protein
MSNYKKIKSTIMVPEDTYKETRILAIRRGMDIGSLVDEALREKIVRDYQKMGLQPPFPQNRPQPPSKHDEPVVHSARYEAARGAQTQPKIINKIIRLPGIEFPADRSKIIKEAEKSTTPTETKYLRHIPERKYKNVLDLENELNRENSTEDTTMLFKVINEKLRKEQENKVIS